MTSLNPSNIRGQHFVELSFMYYMLYKVTHQAIYIGKLHLNISKKTWARQPLNLLSSCQIIRIAQNSIQSHHWCTKQYTVTPSVHKWFDIPRAVSHMTNAVSYTGAIYSYTSSYIGKLHFIISWKTWASVNLLSSCKVMRIAQNETQSHHPCTNGCEFPRP